MADPASPPSGAPAAPLEPFDSGPGANSGPVARSRELDEAHRARRTSRASFLLHWARALIGPPGRPAASPLPALAPGEASVTWLGHASVLVRYAGAQAAVDPCFARWLYGVRRARAPALPEGSLEGTELVLLTHGHRDHLHRPSLRRFRPSATAIVPTGCAADLSGLFDRVVELEPAGRFLSPGLEVIAVPAQHPRGGRGPAGRRRALGYVLRGDGPTVYVAGDTGYFSGFHEIGARFHPDIAVLPISGYRPLAMRADHLSPLDAVYAFEDLGARVLIPIHHGDFPFGYEPLDEPRRWMEELARERRIESRVALIAPGTSAVLRR